MSTPRICPKCGTPLPAQGSCPKCLAKSARQDASSTEDPHIPDHQLIHPAIGGGSYGTVYLALTLTNTYRAIKVVRRDRFTQERPFRREFEGLLKFEPISRTHPGFVSILYVGQNQQDGYFYYIMEAADDIVSGPNVNPKAYRPKTLSLALQAQG